jgi:predicted permease
MTQEAPERERRSRVIHLMLDRAANHLRYSIRLLTRSPLFALSAVLSLAIGIGANTAIFTVANGLLLAPLPGVRDPSRLVDIGRTTDGRGFDTVSFLTFTDLRAASQSFENVFAIRMEPQALSIGGEQGAEVAYGEVVSASYFDVLGLTPAVGVFFHSIEEDVTVPLRKVVLSHAYWKRRFNSDRTIAGQSLIVNGATFTVAGVAPEGHHGTTVLSPDLWAPMTGMARGLPTIETLRGRQNAGFTMTARLKPGVSVAQASAETTAIMKRLAEQYPEPYARLGLVVMPSSRVPGEVGDVVTPFLAALMAIVGLVLLVACANLAGLMLARATSRSREIAVRLALGASRASLAGLLITESLVLFGFGAVAALVVARGLTSLILASFSGLPAQVSLDTGLDWRILLFTAGLALVTGVLTGLGPALQSTRARLVPDLKADASTPRAQRLRSVFVAGQMAFCLVLVLIAGLFLRALSKAIDVNPGFDVDRVEVASVDLGHGGYPEERLPSVAEELRSRFAALPGVEIAAVAAVIPLEDMGLGLGDLRLAGTSGRGSSIDTDWNLISPEYLGAIGTPLALGRNFTAADRAGTPRVAIVNEHFARAVWPNGNAVDQTLESGDFRPGRENSIERITVVGVARDAKYRWIGEAPRNFIYVPIAQHQWGRAQFFLRHGGRAVPGLGASVRAALKAYDPNLPLVRIQSLRAYANLGLLPQRLAASIAGSLGGVALLLAAIGLYGLTAYAVASRAREIGIRMALGASDTGVVRLMLGRGLRLVLIGGGIGLAVAVGLAQLLSGFLFGVSPLDPAAYALTVGVLGLVALVATYVPARRAAAVDPLISLRSE